MPHTYILKTANNGYYVGSTDDLEKRLRAHRLGKVKTTKSKLPITLVYAEPFSARGAAQRLKNHGIVSHHPWPHRLSVRTAAFQAVKRGSTPLGATNAISSWHVKFMVAMV